MQDAANGRHPDAVLVMDEDKVVREVIAELAAGEGMRALVAEEEAEALLALGTYPGRIPFLVLDLRLKHCDGFALGTRLSLPRPALRILYVSSHPREDFRQFASLRRQDVLLPKPFQLEVFRDLIRPASIPAATA